MKSDGTTIFSALASMEFFARYAFTSASDMRELNPRSKCWPFFISPSRAAAGSAASGVSSRAVSSVSVGFMVKAATREFRRVRGFVTFCERPRRPHVFARTLRA
jgi:hypothetical protein